jgi:putative ABC transport system permease protein
MSNDGWSGSFDIESRPSGSGEPPHAEYNVAQPGYFRAVRIALTAGRDFTAQDANDQPAVVIVDSVLAAQAWPNESALGKRLNPGNRVGDWATVVGVVSHVRRSGPRAEGEGQIYLPLAQRAQWSVYYAVHGTGSPMARVSEVRRAVRDLDPDLPVAKVSAVSSLVARGVARERFSMAMLGVFGAVALVLAAVGLYGVMGYLVSQRTQEIGVRMALGGRRGDIFRLIVGEGLAMTVAGLGVGLVVAFAVSRWVARLLYGVQPTDPPTVVAIVLVLVGVALLATYVPARRAMGIDPARALRE